MEAEVILQNIFGKYNVMEMRKILPQTSNTNFLSTTDSIEMVKTYFRYTLIQSTSQENLTDNRIGRIGQKEVKFDINSRVGLMISSPDRNSVIAQGNFCTIRANTGVYKNKWMYEVQIGSKGIMQIGWGTINCKYSLTVGVGDTPNSYSYDGNRIKKWNVNPIRYGEKWVPGDIIGCTLDMNEGIMSFYRNGRNLGVAFDEIPMGPGMAYFPTISLTYTESLTAIFGDIPFRYPVEDYQPIEMVPEIEIAHASFIIHWINQILDYMIQLNYNILLVDNSITVQAYLNCILEDLMKKLSPLLSISYVVEVVFIPFLYDITDIKSLGAKASLSANKSRIKIMTFLDILWTFLDETQVKHLLEEIIGLLYLLFRHIPFQPEYSKQFDILALLINLCLHTQTRHYYLNYELFDRVRFFNFVYIKPMDHTFLEHIINEPWWETNPLNEVINSRKFAYFKAIENIKLLIKDLEKIQVLFLKILLDNNDGTATRVSSRNVFLTKFQNFIYDNFVRTAAQVHHVPLALSLCSFYRLLTVFRELWTEEVGNFTVYIPCKFFYDETINYRQIDRLGGVLSYLKKTYKYELIKRLGPDHRVIKSIEQPQNNSSRFTRRGYFQTHLPLYDQRNIENNLQMEFTENYNQQLPTLVSNKLLILLDALILFYHGTVKRQVSKLSALQDNIFKFSTALSEIKKRLIVVENYRTNVFQMLQQELINTMGVFEQELCNLSRQMAWIRATVFSEENMAQIGWFLNVVSLTLHVASEEGYMFTFVPEFYLSALADLCNAIRVEINSITPLQVIPDHTQILLHVSEFICRHYFSPIIINIKSRETLLLLFAGFVSNPITLRTLENVNLSSRLRVIRNLLRPAEYRCWAHSLWILMRFWQGHGFAFRYKNNPHYGSKYGQKLIQQPNHPKPSPSVIFQLHIRDRLIENIKCTERFLNGLLNQINWAFSEFIGMVQEIYDISLKKEKLFIDSHELKICYTCFEITVTSLRVLEMICFLTPSIFTDETSNCETLLCRLFQLLCQILNRMSSKNDIFQKVLSLNIPHLALLDHFPLLTAVIGILLLILKNDMSCYMQNPQMKVSRVTDFLLKEPSFELSSLYFVLGEVNPKSSKITNILQSWKNTKSPQVWKKTNNPLSSKKETNNSTERFSLLKYNENLDDDFINDEEILKIRVMLNYLEYCDSRLPDSKNLSDDENICTICYANPKDSKFIPCGHMTCHLCINHHILNKKECFFCKAKINQVVNINDTPENSIEDSIKQQQTGL
ncbi:PREDICTED: E3 ubiquitin-protein ligase RNF123-like isoform X2 [Polistes dominula]|nr:PREDICTED: E3 ubiquitin-protein ligase RNF123-like isoform X2 [Polistes dominula]